MRLLYEVKEVPPQTATELIDQYQERLQGIEPCGLYDLEDLLKAAFNELEVLSERKLLSQETCFSVYQQLNWLKMQLPTLERCICHGDFGDRNIMMDQDRKYYVIDWEDAFWGYKEYDYIYWLTFFNHRKYYQMKDLLDVGERPEIEKATATLILIIKEAISLYSGSYRNNSLGLEDRLLEMWKIWDTRI